MGMVNGVAAMMFGPIGITEWIVIVAVALLVFGGKRLGELGRGLGEGIRNFRSAVTSKDEGEKNSKPSA